MKKKTKKFIWMFTNFSILIWLNSWTILVDLYKNKFPHVLPLSLVSLRFYLGSHLEIPITVMSYNEHDGVSYHRRHDYLLNCLFRRRSKKTSKLHATGLCEGNSPVTGKFPAQRASNAENVPIWWRLHAVIGRPSLQLGRWDLYCEMLFCCLNIFYLHLLCTINQSWITQSQCSNVLMNVWDVNWRLLPRSNQNVHWTLPWRGGYFSKCLYTTNNQYEECWARSRYQGQGQVITSYLICGM